MTYDEKSRELAEHFLSDIDGATEEHVVDLACEIQHAIEDWLATADLGRAPDADEILASRGG